MSEEAAAVKPFGDLDSAQQACQLLEWIEPAVGWDAQLREKRSNNSILIITGASGSGKSRVLRDLAESIDPQIFAAPPPTSIARTDTWRSLSLREPSIAHWEHVWRCAIFASLLTHMREHRNLLTKGHRKRLKKLVKRLPQELFSLDFARHPFGIIQVIAKSLQGATDPYKSQFFQGSEWHDAETFVRQAVTDTRPVFLEFDNLDDYFDNDPSVMSEVQAGLVQFLGHLEREPLPRDRVIIYASVSSSAYRFLRRHRVGDASQFPSLTEVTWSLPALRQFAGQGLLNMSLELVDNAIFSPLCESAVIVVPERGVEESIDNYILRHTSLVPRDVALIGNSLAAKFNYLGRKLTVAELRSEVGDVAALLASMRTSRAVSELTALGYRSVPDRIASPDGGAGERTLDLQLRTLATDLGKERFDRAALLSLVETWDEPTRAYLLESLWDARLLAICPNGDGTRRISRTVFDQLPRIDGDLAFVPILLDLYELQPTSEEVFLEFV